jgi:uncharacterized NAD-dependent epimerase/dehydratase family protein
MIIVPYVQKTNDRIHAPRIAPTIHTNPKVRCGGVALNTAGLSESAARQKLADSKRWFGLPAADPIRAEQDSMNWCNPA